MPRGGKRNGAGRPVGSAVVLPANALSVQVAVRLTVSEKKALEERAAANGLAVSKYVRKILFD